MNPKALLDKIATVKEDSVYVFPPQLGVRVGETDALAARLLTWLQAELPEGTVAEFDDVLTTALWWNTYLTSLEELPEPDAPEPARPEWLPTIVKAED